MRLGDGDQWKLVTDLILVVPRAKFYSGFRPIMGLAHKFQNGWSLAATGVALSFGVGYRAQFVGGKMYHIFAFGPTLVFSF